MTVGIGTGGRFTYQAFLAVQASRLLRIVRTANFAFTTRPKIYFSGNIVTTEGDGTQVSPSTHFNLTHLSRIGALSKADGAPAGYQAGTRSMLWPFVHRFQCTGATFRTRSSSANTWDTGDLLLKLLEVSSLASSLP